MSKSINKLIITTIILSVAVFCAAFQSVAAQSFSSDTLGNGERYFEGNLWTATQSHRNGGEQIYGGRFAYGLTKNVEVGVGGSFSNPHDIEYPPEIQPNLKWKFYENETRGITASTGVTAFIPFARGAGTDGFAMVYANLSKNVRKLNGATFTVGGYTLIGRNKEFGSRKGFNFVYDQPLARRVSFSAQWVTGDNRFGYVTPGFNFVVSKRSSLFAGYSIGNYGYDNHGPYISYSIRR